MSVQRIEQNPRMSEASKAGNLVILAGQVADGETVASQAQSIFDSIDALLEKAGTNKANILFANIYLTDINDFDELNKVWESWVAADQGQTPSRATMQVVRLARPEWKVEVQVFATV
jgi:enamine deaminase RidA (YjgF/YER057c/UK114 family)